MDFLIAQGDRHAHDMFAFACKGRLRGVLRRAFWTRTEARTQASSRANAARAWVTRSLSPTRAGSRWNSTDGSAGRPMFAAHGTRPAPSEDSLRHEMPRPALSASCRPATPDAECDITYGTLCSSSSLTTKRCNWQVDGSSTRR